MSAVPRLSPVVLGVVLTLLLLAATKTPRVDAQVSSDQAQVFLPTGGEYVLLWERVQTFAERENWDAVLEGLSRYIDLVNRPEANDVVSSGARLTFGIRRLFARVVSALPGSVKEDYRERLDGVLQRIWTDTHDEISERERGNLRHRILRDYPQSSLYRELLREDIDEAFEQGHWQRARRSAEQLLVLPNSDEEESTKPKTLDDAKAHLVLSQLFSVWGESDSLQLHLNALSDLQQSPQFADLPAPLKTQVTRTVKAAPLVLASYRVRRDQRTPSSHSSQVIETQTSDAQKQGERFELGRAVWSLSVAASRLRPTVSQLGIDAVGPGNVGLPFFPAVDGNTVFFQHSDRLVAYDVEGGRLLWLNSLKEETQAFSGIRIPVVGTRSCYAISRSHLFAFDRDTGKQQWSKQFVYDVKTKTLTSADRLAGRPAETGGVGAELDHSRQSGKGEGTERNTTTTEEEPGGERAVEEEDTGENETEEDESAEPQKDPKRDEAETAVCLLTPPAFHHDTLIVPITVRLAEESLVYVVSLDRRGEVTWVTYLGSTGSSNHLGLGSFSSLPTSDGARIYVLTNQGFMAALDGEDGTIDWLLQYPTLAARSQKEAIRTSNRWQVNPIVRVNESLLIAPQDSTRLMGVDRSTGAILWETFRERSSTFLGATETACIVAGKSLSAIAHSDTDSGNVLWRRQTDLDGFMAFGRAVLNSDAIYIPGRRSLLTVSPRTGAVLSRTYWDFGGGGNLLASAGAHGPILALATPESLIVYNDRAQEKREIEEMTENSPQNILKRSEYSLRNYDLRAGLRELERWRASSPASPAPNSPMEQLHLELAELTLYFSQREIGKERQLDLLRYRALLERTPKRKVIAELDLAGQLEEANELGEALETYHRALDHDRRKTEYFLAGNLPVGAAEYIRRRVQRLREATPNQDKTFATVEREATKRLKQARQRSTPLGFEEILQRFPFTRAAAAAHLDLYQEYVDRLSYEQAIRTLESYIRDYDSDTRIAPEEIARAKLQLVKLLFESGRRQEAKATSLALIEQHGALIVSGVSGMSPGETIRQYLQPRLSDPGLVTLPDAEPPALRSPLGTAWRSPADLSTISRRFLKPGGTPPKELSDCFLTQSNKVVECRAAATGLSLWRIPLPLIPGFQLNTSSFLSRLPRRGSRELRGSYQGELLVLHDESNLFAVDAVTGTVRWHLPFGEKESKGLRRLRERLHRVLVVDSGVYAISSHQHLYHFNLNGERLWERKLSYHPNPTRTPVLAQNKLFVFSRKPNSLQIHDALSGELQRSIGGGHKKTDRLIPHSQPVRLSDDRLLLPYERRIELLDLNKEELIWTFNPKRSGTRIDTVSYFEESPGECVAFISRPGNHPAMISLSLRTGEERWRYERFPSKRSRFSVFREGNRFYVIYGVDSWHLLALDLRPGAEIDKPVIAPVWPSNSKLGTFYSGARQRQLYVGSDILVFHDPNNTISVHDKSQGTLRPAVAEEMNRFLVEKGSFASDLVNGKFVVLTDGGDCAFESTSIQGQNRQFLTDIGLVERWLKDPSSADLLAQIAQEYFRKGKLNAAIEILDRALLSESEIAGQSQREQLRIRYLLDGYKQESMERLYKQKNQSLTITTKRAHHPPTVDGRLNDWWDIGSRVRMESPLHVGMVPGPEQLKHWEGREDLAATLYTGWDDGHFYFALDVTDDVLWPYDRDAENWKGDCLIIGLDPTGDMGYRQRGNDQLMTLALTIPKRRNNDKPNEKEEEEGDAEEEEKDEGRRPDGVFAVKRKTDNTGAIYEVALPWSAFSPEFADGARPESGYQFGLSLLLTDDDTGQGVTKTLSINPCHLLPHSQKSSLVWRFIVPNFFPRVKLE